MMEFDSGTSLQLNPRHCDQAGVELSLGVYLAEQYSGNTGDIAVRDRRRRPRALRVSAQRAAPGGGENATPIGPRVSRDVWCQAT
jgi:hypothetical protein